MKPIAALRLRSTGGSAPVTWNPADKNANIVLSSGNLIAGKGSGSGAFHGVRATAGIDVANSGYFEVKVLVTTSPSDLISGVELLAADINSYPGSDAFGWGYYHRNGQIIFNAGGAAYGGSLGNSDVLGIAFKAGKIWFALNNVYQSGGNPVAGTGAAFSGLSGVLYPAVSIFDITDSVLGCFKAGHFTYSPPAGFAAFDPN